MNRQPRPADRPRTLSSLESLVVCGAVGVALFLLGAAGALPGNAMRYLLQIFLYITLGEAWNLLSGFAGLTSLGQQLYVGLAGYALAVVTTTLRLPFALGLRFPQGYPPLNDVPFAFGALLLAALCAFCLYSSLQKRNDYE